MDRKTTQDAGYYHQVVDCQWACPAHTPVPEYIRLVAEKKYTEAYMVNRNSNVFPGILGRVCDRPCEPACRRGRVEEKPVAICRLKRVAADFRGDIKQYLPAIPGKKNGKKVALIGAGPGCLTVANDLMPLGYEIHLYDKEARAGGAMRSQVPGFRLPEKVLDEEIDVILGWGVTQFFSQEVASLWELINSSQYDALVVGTGAPIGKDLNIPGRKEVGAHVHIAFYWLANVAFKHTQTVGKKVAIIGGGNTAMDCARTAKRLGAEQVCVFTPEKYQEMTASPWEKTDAEHEGIEIKNLVLPLRFEVAGKKPQIIFQELESCYDEGQKWNPVAKVGETLTVNFDEVIIAVGQKTSFTFIEPECQVEFLASGLPKLNPLTYQSTFSKVFFVGDAAFGPKNIITAVASGHEVALSIDLMLQGKDPNIRPKVKATMKSQVLGYQQLGYRSDYDDLGRTKVPEISLKERFKSLQKEVEKGFTEDLGLQEAKRCLNCDVQTVFSAAACIECDGCVDICPMACLTLTAAGELELLKNNLKAPPLNESQILFTAEVPLTHRLMVKDEDLCVHCGLCAQRCPTGAWDMQMSLLTIPHAGNDRHE